MAGNGLQLLGEPANSAYVEAVGSSAQIASTFGVRLGTYRVRGNDLRASDGELSDIIFRALVDRPTPARVVEGAGSTQEAEWFDPAKALSLDLTDVAHDAVANLTHSDAG